MNATTFAALRRGIEAGLVASVPQVLGTHLHGKILGFSPGSANLGPRLIERLGKLTSRRPSEEIRWLGSASFHFIYSAGWGALYALAYQHRPVHPVVGGLLLSGTIYALTFPGWGFATWTRTERPPRRRSWRRELLLIAPPLIFGLGTALLYGRGPRRGEVLLAEEILRDPLRRREAETEHPRRTGPEPTGGHAPPWPRAPYHTGGLGGNGEIPDDDVAYTPAPTPGRRQPD